ncbi:unnamed protein product [Boreogadus saida]
MAGGRVSEDQLSLLYERWYGGPQLPTDQLSLLYERWYGGPQLPTDQLSLLYERWYGGPCSPQTSCHCCMNDARAPSVSGLHVSIQGRSRMLMKTLTLGHASDCRGRKGEGKKDKESNSGAERDGSVSFCGICFCASGDHESGGLVRPPSGLVRPPSGLVRPPSGLVRPPSGLVRPPSGLVRPPAL